LENPVISKKTIYDVEVEGKKVFVRVDFNVPIENGTISDDTRIKAALPTIEYLLKNGAGIILASHLGRPGGVVDQKYSLRPVADRLELIFPGRLFFSDDCRGNKPRLMAAELEMGQILLLENTRFYPGEKENDPAMGKELASLADLFVNDAFGTAHRAHASNVGIAKYLPSAAGILLEKEITYLGKTIANPARPFIAILGGAKISGKIGVIDNLLDLVDKILIGGGMANTFFAAQGFDIADSLVEKDVLKKAAEIIEQAGNKLILPVDLVIGNEFSKDAELKTMLLGDVPESWRIMDIGEKSLNKFESVIKESKTIVWNGPMGVFEFPAFAKGTFKLAEIVAQSDAVSIIGGGDSAAAISIAGLNDQITHISTGGGASLQMLEGRSLPGLEALDDR
jgi:phosphoglycerate kinase